MRGSRSWVVVIAALLAPLQAPAQQDVPFLESPDSVVDAMLEMAKVGADDVVYDLGSGDGRIVIAAAAKRGAQAVGIEIEPDLVRLSNENASEVGVVDRVRFVEGDLFEADFSEATVVMMYLYPKVNRRLRPVLERQLAPGTRVISHRYEIDGWTPVEVIRVEGRRIYSYVTPRTR